MDDENTEFAKAVKAQFDSAITAMAREDHDATMTMLSRVNSGAARLMIVIEWVPEFIFKLVYIGPDGTGDVYRLTEGHGEVTLQ